MNEEIKPENMRIHSRADELIACLEGEIAKRDEVIVGLTNSRDFWREKAIAADDELAAIKAQEPVSYTYASKQETQCAGCGIRKHTPLRVDEMGGYVCLTCIDKKLEDFYAAPVSEAKAQGVVMPEPMKRGDEGGSGEYGAAMIRGYNACLREVARLNAAPVQQVVPDEMRSLAQRLREYNQNPHHINPMSEAFHILVSDAANALSTACVPKEIAAAITWSEHLLFECGALTSTRAPSVHVYNKTFAAVNEARAMLATAPSAPAADAGVNDHD